MARIPLHRKALSLAVVVAVLVSGCGMSEGEPSEFTYQGAPVMDLGPSLGQFETLFQDLVKEDRGLLTDGSGCFLSTLAGAATEEVVCGPVAFPGGSLDRVWVRYQATYEPVTSEGFGGEDVVGHRAVPTEDPPTVGTALGPSEKLGGVDGTIEDADTLGRLTSVPSYETMGRSFSESLSESPTAMESMNASVSFPGASIRLTATGSAEGYRMDGEPRVAPDGAEFLFVELEASGNPGSLVSRIEMADEEARTFSMPEQGSVLAMVVPVDSEPQLVVSDGNREQRLNLRNGQVQNGAMAPLEYAMEKPLTGRFQPINLCVDEFSGDGQCENRQEVVYEGSLELPMAVRVSNVAMASSVLPQDAAQVVATYDEWAPEGSDMVVLPIPDSAVSFRPSPVPQSVEVTYGFDAMLTAGDTEVQQTTIETEEYDGVIMVFQPPSDMENPELSISMRLSWTEGDRSGSVQLEAPLTAPLR